MLRKPISLIDDWSGGQDTKTPLTKMGLNKSPNMRNFHCAGVANRLMKRGGFAKLNSTAVETDDLDACYPPGYQTADHKLRDTATNTKISQGFKPSTSSTVTKIRLWLKSTGTPAGTDTVTLAIHANSSGVPAASAITNGTATAVDISDTLTSSYAWVEFTFSTNPSLTASTQYHLVLSGAFTISAVNYVLWGIDDYDVIYPDGSMSVNDGTTWTTETNFDACFEVYITGGSKGDNGIALLDFSSKNMILGIFGTQLYKMDKSSAGTPDGTWDAVGGGSSWDTFTKFISHFDGSDAATAATDEIGNVITFVGTAQLDTAQKKFGTASLLLDGNSDYLTVPDSDDWNFGTGNFTIDLQIKMNSDKRQYFIAQSVDGSHYWRFGFTGTDKLTFNMENGAVIIPTLEGVFTYDTSFHHVAIVRSGNSFNLYLDGVSIANSTDSDSMPDLATTLDIGFEIPDGTYYDGWLDEVRVSKGIARYTANFTPPIAAYSADKLSITASRYWTFGDWQSGRALINSDIGLYTYTGTGDASVVSAAPLGKYFTIWKNYAFVFGIRGNQNQGRYSTLNDYTAWPAANTLNFNTNDGDVVTGVRILKGKLYIFKRYSVHRVTFLGSNPTFQIDQILGRGTPSHYSIKEVDMGGDIGTVLIFLTTDKKLAIFDGYNIQVLSDTLSEETNDLFEASDDQPLSFADMNFTYSDLFHAVVKQDTYEYILYCVLGSDREVNYAFVLDYKTGGIYPYDGQIFESSIYLMSTDKSKLLYTSGRSGLTFQMESGDDDNGSDINAYWVSAKIKPSLVSLAVKMLQAAIHFKEITSASTLNIGFQYRNDWNVSWSSSENFNYDHNDELAFGKTQLFEIGTIENMFQIKLKDDSSNPAPTIYGVDLYGKQLGQEVGDRAVV